MKFFLRYKKDENGQSLVEFALILPIMLLLLMGIVQFGFIFNGQITLTSAAREGARLAVVTGPNAAGNFPEADALIRARVDAAAVALLLNVTSADIDIKRSPDGGLLDGMLSVTVDGRVKIIMPLLPMVVGNDFDLSGESKMRIEYE